MTEQQLSPTSKRQSSWRTSTTPWLAALLVGAGVHGGWLVHTLTQDEPTPQIVVKPQAPTVVVVSADGSAKVLDAEDAACDGERRRHRKDKRKRKHRKRRRADAEEAMTAMSTDAIVCDGPHCTIDRAMFEAWMDNPGKVAKSARVVPSKRDGQVNGFKLYGIRSGSVARMLGFHNGDLVTAVGGRPLGSIDAAMAAYSTVQTSDDIVVELVRKGEAMTKEFHLR